MCLHYHIQVGNLFRPKWWITDPKKRIHWINYCNLKRDFKILLRLTLKDPSIEVRKTALKMVMYLPEKERIESLIYLSSKSVDPIIIDNTVQKLLEYNLKTTIIDKKTETDIQKTFEIHAKLIPDKIYNYCLQNQIYAEACRCISELIDLQLDKYRHEKALKMLLISKIRSARDVELYHIDKIGEIIIKIGDQETIESVLPLLEDKNFNIRNCAILILDELGWVPSNTKEKILSHIAHNEWENIIPFKNEAIDLLENALEMNEVYGDPSKRRNPNKEALITLLKVVKTWNDINQEKLIFSLRYPAVVKEFLEFVLENKDRSASEFIFKIANRDIPSSSDPSVLHFAIRVLGEITNERKHIEFLEQVANRKVKDLVFCEFDAIIALLSYNPISYFDIYFKYVCEYPRSNYKSFVDFVKRNIKEITDDSLNKIMVMKNVGYYLPAYVDEGPREGLVEVVGEYVPIDNTELVKMANDELELRSKK